MFGFLLMRTTDRKFVTMPGSEHSYSAAIEDARVYSTREEAEKDRCVENEVICKLHIRDGRIVYDA